MPRLILPELGNGRRPGSEGHERRSSESAVPILDVSKDTHELVGVAHDAALDPKDKTTLLTGTVLRIDNPRPADAPDSVGSTLFVIGGSTLHEAATDHKQR